jgi:hypothetical protein
MGVILVELECATGQLLEKKKRIPIVAFHLTTVPPR